MAEFKRMYVIPGRGKSPLKNEFATGDIKTKKTVRVSLISELIIGRNPVLEALSRAGLIDKIFIDGNAKGSVVQIVSLARGKRHCCKGGHSSRSLTPCPIGECIRESLLQALAPSTAALKKFWESQAKGRGSLYNNLRRNRGPSQFRCDYKNGGMCGGSRSDNPQTQKRLS